MPIFRSDKSKDFIRKQERAIAAGLLLTAELVATKVREETPVVTGRLRESIKSTGRIERKRGKFNIKVTTPVTYAPHVEFGTSKFTPRAMFRKGINENKDLFLQTFSGVVKSIL